MIYNKPTHLLDVEEYVKLANDSISTLSIKIMFKKAKIMRLEDAVKEPEADLMAEIIQNFTFLNIQIENGTLEEFLYIDDENNEE